MIYIICLIVELTWGLTLWCEKGVYGIAKELQMLNPDKFGNIFLGLGGFYLEEVVIDCCGKYLEESVIDSIFVELEIFVPELATSVMTGGKLYTWEMWNSIDIRSSSTPSVFSIYKNC